MAVVYPTSTHPKNQESKNQHSGADSKFFAENRWDRESAILINPSLIEINFVNSWCQFRRYIDSIQVIKYSIPLII